jgi:hypothetical protein
VAVAGSAHAEHLSVGVLNGQGDGCGGDEQQEPEQQYGSEEDLKKLPHARIVPRRLSKAR